MRGNERPLVALPKWLVIGLGVALCLQIAWKTSHGPPPRGEQELPSAPSVAALRLAAFGEPEALSRLLMIYLQSFDYHGANVVPFRNLDYARLVNWLSVSLALDPRSNYPLFAASHVYAEVRSPDRQRKVLDFIYAEFLRAPDRRWPALAHAALIAKHRLKDLPLALQYARSVDRLTTSPDVPIWAKQMEVFVLEDMGEIDAARIMLGGLLAKGQITDATERRYMEARLKEMEARRDRSKAGKASGK